jgi:hypothetical protein
MAVRLGRVNVDAMLRSLTAKQFTEWQAYARLEPFAETRADWRTASLSKMLFDQNQKLIDALFAVNGAEKGKRPKIIQTTIQDFLLTWKEEEVALVRPPKRKQTWQEQLAIVEMIVHAHSVPGKNM